MLTSCIFSRFWAETSCFQGSVEGFFSDFQGWDWRGSAILTPGDSKNKTPKACEKTWKSIFDPSASKSQQVGISIPTPPKKVPCHSRNFFVEFRTQAATFVFDTLTITPVPHFSPCHGWLLSLCWKNNQPSTAPRLDDVHRQMSSWPRDREFPYVKFVAITRMWNGKKYTAMDHAHANSRKKTSVPMDASNRQNLAIFTTSHLFPFKSLNIWIWNREKKLLAHNLRLRKLWTLFSAATFDMGALESGPFQHSCSSSSPPDQDWDLQITKRTE